MKAKRQKFSITQWVHLYWSPFWMKKATGGSESKAKPFTLCHSYTERQGSEGRYLSYRNTYRFTTEDQTDFIIVL